MSHHLPDDEALSAHLDGEGDAATAEHLGSCASCEARLVELEAAARAVGTPAGRRPDAARAAAVDAALAAAEGEVPSARRRVPAWVAAAAAALVLLLAAIPVVLSGRDRGDEVAELSRKRTADDSETGALTGVGEPEELGAQSDPQALARLLDERMRAPRLTGEAFATAKAGTADDREAAAEGGSGGAASAPTSGAPCLEEAREAGANRVGTLLYSGLLEWQTTPAVVHVFQAPDPQATTLTRRAFVMARSDCQLLVAPSF